MRKERTKEWGMSSRVVRDRGKTRLERKERLGVVTPSSFKYGLRVTLSSSLLFLS